MTSSKGSRRVHTPLLAYTFLWQRHPQIYNISNLDYSFFAYEIFKAVHQHIFQSIDNKYGPQMFSQTHIIYNEIRHLLWSKSILGLLNRWSLSLDSPTPHWYLWSGDRTFTEMPRLGPCGVALITLLTLTRPWRLASVKPGVRYKGVLSNRIHLCHST